MNLSYRLVMRVKSPDNYFFVEMNFEEDYNEFANQDLIHIHKVNTRGRKCETRVHGIPEIFDYKKMLKFWKNNFQTNGRITKDGKEGKDKRGKDKKQSEDEDGESEEILVVNGDHRQKIKQFLIYMGIADKENIRVHGAS